MTDLHLLNDNHEVIIGCKNEDTCLLQEKSKYFRNSHSFHTAKKLLNDLHLQCADFLKEVMHEHRIDQYERATIAYSMIIYLKQMGDRINKSRKFLDDYKYELPKEDLDEHVAEVNLNITRIYDSAMEYIDCYYALQIAREKRHYEVPED